MRVLLAMYTCGDFTTFEDVISRYQLLTLSTGTALSNLTLFPFIQKKWICKDMRNLDKQHWIDSNRSG